MSTKPENKQTTDEKIEEKGVQKVTELLKTPSSKETMQTQLCNIMKEGEQEFIKEHKRLFTYSDLRRLYG